MEKMTKDKIIFALTGMSECGKSTVGKYLDLRMIPRLKIGSLFEQVRKELAPNDELYGFVRREERRDPYALWDCFILKLLKEMDKRKVKMASIESLYGGGLGPYLKRKLGKHFCIIFIDIPLEVRLRRQMQRENLKTIDEAKEILLPRDKIKADSGIPELKNIAGEVVDNSGSVEDMYRIIDNMIIRYKKLLAN